MKKIGKFLSSMPFAITLLVLLAAACAFSSTVSQGQAYEYYAAQYGERTAGLILALHLDDAFHSWWFIGLSAFLCLNLLCCNLIRLPGLLKRVRAFAKPDGTTASNATAEAEGTGDPRRLFAALHMPSVREGENGQLYATGNRAGFWGAWVCHLGILLLILGFALGQITMKQYTVYALPGQTKGMDDSGLQVTVDDLQILRAESGAVQQYTAALTVSDPVNHTEEKGTTGVNAPANLYGYKFFQNSVGWGADVRVLKNGQPRNYTLLAVKRDVFTWLVLLGGLVTLAGLVMAFWLQPRAVCAVKEGENWHVFGRCQKGGVLFREEFLKAAAETGFTPCKSSDIEGDDA